MVLLGHRYYDSFTGRFITRDPIGYGGGINLYGFTGNNPVNMSDPDGFGYEPIDEAVDLGFVAYDVGKIVYNGFHHTSNAESALDGGALALDLIGLAPGAPPGLGRGVILAHSGVVALRALRVAREARASVKAAQVGISFAAASGGGRSGKQPRLRQILNDPKASSADRGWIKQEINAIKQGNRKTIRVPFGKVMAHKRGMRAKNGHSYLESDLQDVDLHKLEHKHGGY